MSVDKIKHPDTGQNVTCPLKVSVPDTDCNNHCGWFDSENQQCSLQTIAYMLSAMVRND